MSMFFILTYLSICFTIFAIYYLEDEFITNQNINNAFKYSLGWPYYFIKSLYKYIKDEIKYFE